MPNVVVSATSAAAQPRTINRSGWRIEAVREGWMYGISTTGDGLTKSRVTSYPTRISMMSACLSARGGNDYPHSEERFAPVERRFNL